MAERFREDGAGEEETERERCSNKTAAVRGPGESLPIAYRSGADTKPAACWLRCPHQRPPARRRLWVSRRRTPPHMAPSIVTMSDMN